MSFRKCYEPHLRDYPACREECNLDSCEAPILSEKKSIKCGNCGVYRMVSSGVVEECLNCGDDEYDINELHQL